MVAHSVTFIDVTGALYDVALNQNRNVVFIWSVHKYFNFIKQINVIFMRLHYEAGILCYCIIKIPL